MDYGINKILYLSLLSLCHKCKNEKCIWKIFVKYTQIRQSNTNTNIWSCGFSNTNTNTNTDICVFKYKYKYVFDPSPGISYVACESLSCLIFFGGERLRYIFFSLIFNSLWPSDAMKWQRTESTLAQVMACCLTAPSHSLNQCWLIISKVLWHSSLSWEYLKVPVSKTRL